MPKQYTIRGIDKDLDRAVRETAAKYGVSVNKAVVSLLKQAVGLGPDKKPDSQPCHDLADFPKCLSDSEADRMLKALRRGRRIDPELWK